MAGVYVSSISRRLMYIIGSLRTVWRSIIRKPRIIQTATLQVCELERYYIYYIVIYYCIIIFLYYCIIIFIIFDHSVTSYYLLLFRDYLHFNL